MRFAALCSLLIVLIPACSNQNMDATIESAGVQATLDTLWTRYADAADRRDSLAFGDLFHPEAALVFSSVPTVMGRVGIQQFLAALYTGVDVTAFRITPQDLRVQGSLAVQSGTFEEDYLESGALKMEVGRFVLVAERGDDKAWRIRRLMAMADSIHVREAAPVGAAAAQ
jgi:hypothetical protein